MFKHYSSHLIIVMTLAFSSAAEAEVQYNADNKDWQQLFNGKDLSGWTPKVTGHALDENPHNTFRVEGGLLKVRYDAYENFDGQFGHLFYEQPFSHYALHVEYRFVGKQATGGPRGWAERNSGVMLHSQSPGSMGLNQEFPDSIEAQFLGGLSDGKPRPTANLCTPGTHVHLDDKLFTPHCTYADSPTLDGDQWVSVTVVVLGAGRIRHLVNGMEVLSYSKPQLDDGSAHSRKATYISEGFIALQSESHPIDFRTVAVLNLAGCTDNNAANYKPYALKHIAGSCVYQQPEPTTPSG